MGYLDESGISHFWNNIKLILNTKQDLSGLIYQCAYPTNKIIFDNVGKPGAYVYIPKFRLCDALSTTDTRIHPAFIKNGVEVDGFYMGKFQSHIIDGREYSLPAKEPSTNVTMDQAVAYNRAKGSKFHEITAAEWAAVSLWCHKNGTEPKGNNDYGKDASETTYKAVPTSYGSDGKVYRVATGTGPVTWSHDGTLEGIWDLNGNVVEWTTGVRLVYGELQVIPYNNAADPACDLSSTSIEWKAINAEATSWDDLFVTPDGNGTTQGTIKMDYINNSWTYSTTISHATTSAGCVFKNFITDATIGDEAKLFLQALALFPDTDLAGNTIAIDYNNDHCWGNNTLADAVTTRGGRWTSRASGGLFNVQLSNNRSGKDTYIGCRSAYQE